MLKLSELKPNVHYIQRLFLVFTTKTFQLVTNTICTVLCTPLNVGYYDQRDMKLNDDAVVFIIGFCLV